MTDDQLLDLTLTEAADRVARRKVSPVELVQAALQRTERIAETNAFISVLAEEALTVAKASEAMINAGHRLGPLHGVPVVLKDNIDVSDQLTTAGSKVLADRRPVGDATVAAKLRSAGAILLGKTNMHEFAWGATSANPQYGFVKNPWDTSRM
ncbi:amidase, partial [Kitasatospora nipponensis]